MNVIIYSLRKSGTVLVVNLVQKINGLQQPHNHFLKDLYYKINGKELEGSITINTNLEFSKENLYFTFQKVIDGIEAHEVQKFIIEKNDFKKILNSYDKNYLTHSGYRFAKYYDDLNFEKKVLNVRNIFDYLNSSLKTVWNDKISYNLMDNLRDQQDFAKLKYSTPSLLSYFILVWKEYVNFLKSYSEKENTFLIKYEDVISHPYETIKRLSNFLEKDLSHEEIDEIEATLFFKELTDMTNRHKYYKHFNNTKRYEWMEYIPKSLYEEIFEYVKDELEFLGYEKIEYKDLGDKSFKSEMEYRYKNVDFENYSYNSFLDELLHRTDKKRVAIYGYGEYGKELIKALNLKDIIIFDDNNVTDAKPIKEIVKYLHKIDVLLVTVAPHLFSVMHKNIYENIYNYGDIEVINAFNLHFNYKIGFMGI